MILERLPDVLALSNEQKEVLAEELLHHVALEQKKDPALRELIRERLQAHEADPEAGIPWEKLRDRLLKQRNA